MFFGISQDDIKTITGLAPALSVAEMLSARYPSISNAFLQYSSQLVENSIIVYEKDKKLIEIKKIIDSKINGTKIASVSELEKFADHLVHRFSKNPTIPELPKIAYMTYAVTSIFGPLQPEISKKMVAAEKMKPAPQPAPQNTPEPKKYTLKRLSSTTSVEKPVSLMLADIAKESFKHKDADVAFAALTAVIKELEK